MTDKNERKATVIVSVDSVEYLVNVRYDDINKCLALISVFREKDNKEMENLMKYKAFWHCDTKMNLIWSILFPENDEYKSLAIKDTFRKKGEYVKLVGIIIEILVYVGLYQLGTRLSLYLHAVIVNKNNCLISN